jgi:hypothetical protein
MLIGSQSADSISTSVVFGVAARMLAAHDPADRFHAIVIGDDDICGFSVYSRVSSASTFSPSFARRTTSVALDLGGVEDVQRTALVEGHVVGDVDQRR